VAPADGKIIAIEKVSKSPLFNGNLQKVSVFMTVFNVHVNRIPFNGNIKEVRYFPGKFFSANLDKASSDNEKNAIWIETEGGNRYCVVQIAGLIARRIICRVEKGNPVTRGQRFGIICFGSRVDTYLPQDVDLSVAIGDRTRAGETVLGYLP
jgi:phosphatidylserine decarboxylase